MGKGKTNPHWGHFTDPDADPGIAPASGRYVAPNETLPVAPGNWMSGGKRSWREQKEDPEVCPDCKEAVRYSTDGHGQLVVLTPRWERHVCVPPSEPTDPEGSR